MKLRSIILPLLAVSLIASAKIGSANAYFTTHVTAKGFDTVHWQHSEKIDEKYHDNIKYVSIKNLEEKNIPVFVRARAFYGDLGYKVEINGTNWIKGNGDDPYYYYTKPLPGGQVTDDLLVHIKDIPNVAPEVGDNYNIIVVYECIPATYNQNGEPNDPQALDWSGAARSTKK